MIGKDEFQESLSYSKDKNEQASFLDGILWFKDNLWHDIKEYPEGENEILFEHKFDGIDSLCYATTLIINREDYIKHVLALYDVRRWCYINDLISK